MYIFEIDKAQIDMRETLFSGQVFKVTVADNGYYLQSLHHICYITESENSYIIECDSAESVPYFENYFCLDFNYEKVKNGVTNEYALTAIESAKMLKIMRQAKFETLIDFIVSANNNILRIRKILFAISEEFGDKIQFKNKTFHAFPTVFQLSKGTEADFKRLGLGYRASYIVRTCQMIISGFDIENIPNDTILANKHLCKLFGVGEKVADCILLFAYQKYDAFPVDTWIEKLYYEDFQGETATRKDIRKFFINLFGEHAGIVQQYMFYYKRLEKE
ncbi:MAG: hypothetical protein R3Y18_00260 [Bacillota bacterium]